jgi:hypothetical protein
LTPLIVVRFHGPQPVGNWSDPALARHPSIPRGWFGIKMRLEGMGGRRIADASEPLGLAWFTNPSVSEARLRSFGKLAFGWKTGWNTQYG